MLEKDFQTKVLKWLRLNFYASWWMKANDRTTIGVPDIIGGMEGLFIALELKTTSRVSRIQAHTLLKINQENVAFIVTPNNWEKTKDSLSALYWVKKNCSLDELKTLRTTLLAENAAAYWQPSMRRKSK